MHYSLLVLILLVGLTLGADMCGNGVCESTENVFWCSQDCSGKCGDEICSRDESLSSCGDCECAETEEERLGRLINEYRATAGLRVVPIGIHMSTVARAHARDSAVSSSNNGECNLHSWSGNTFDGLEFSSCCYTSDHKESACMWNKPKEMTSLSGNGYEISAQGYGSVDDALSGWKSSSGHNTVIMNEGIWAQYQWRYMGVGVSDSDTRWYHVWFYAEDDDSPKESECSESSNLLPLSSLPSESPVSVNEETPSITPSPSTSEVPGISNSLAPSQSSSTNPSESPVPVMESITPIPVQSKPPTPVELIASPSSSVLPSVSATPIMEIESPTQAESQSSAPSSSVSFSASVAPTIELESSAPTPAESESSSPMISPIGYPSMSASAVPVSAIDPNLLSMSPFPLEAPTLSPCPSKEGSDDGHGRRRRKKYHIFPFSFY